jgi:hypothetical protein
MRPPATGVDNAGAESGGACYGAPPVGAATRAGGCDHSNTGQKTGPRDPAVTLR